MAISVSRTFYRESWLGGLGHTKKVRYCLFYSCFNQKVHINDAFYWLIRKILFSTRKLFNKSIRENGIFNRFYCTWLFKKSSSAHFSIKEPQHDKKSECEEGNLRKKPYIETEVSVEDTGLTRKHFQRLNTRVCLLLCTSTSKKKHLRSLH